MTTERTPRILLIEDDEDMRRVVVRCLKEYDFLEASDGGMALQFAEQGDKEGDIVLVIQDLKLPHTDPSLTGMRLLYRIHGTLGPSVPILVVSAGDLTEVYEAGLFRSLQKPFTPSQLRGVVRELIASTQRSRGGQAQARPTWMALLGVGTFIGGLVSQWQLEAPTTVWVPMLVLSLLLIWIGPAPADAFAIILKWFTKK